MNAQIDLAIEGMTCAACVRRVERALARVPGVRLVEAFYDRSNWCAVFERF